MTEIESLIKANKLEQAIERLDREIEAHPDRAELWYTRGRVYWRMGQKGKAITDYEEAAHLDPESPAKMALEMSHDIMDFYNKDLYNP